MASATNVFASDGRNAWLLYQEKKLYFALSELLLTDHSIYQIALTYGFDTQQSFTRVFKNQFGLPPAMFRREAKEKLPFRSELIKYPYQDTSLKFHR